MALICFAQAQTERAVEFIALQMLYSQSFITSSAGIPPWIEKLVGDFPPEVFERAVERGKARDLDATVNELLAELRQQVQEEAPLHPQSRPDVLSQRELEILRLVTDGLSNREIADRLVLAVSTVKWYLSEIMSKLHATNRTEAVARAREIGMLT